LLASGIVNRRFKRIQRQYIPAEQSKRGAAVRIGSWSHFIDGRLGSADVSLRVRPASSRIVVDRSRCQDPLTRNDERHGDRRSLGPSDLFLRGRGSSDRSYPLLPRGTARRWIDASELVQRNSRHIGASVCGLSGLVAGWTCDLISRWSCSFARSCVLAGWHIASVRDRGL
jgi:hypothetical protein